MLLELSIENFAIVDRLRLRPGPHFNTLTGETGAGKSILIDAVSALVGERVGADAVRAGAERALIEGIFDVSALLAPAIQANGRQPDRRVGSDDGQIAPGEPEDGAGKSLSATLGELGIEPEEGVLILAREVAQGGRSTARINGRAVPVSVLQRVAAVLIDIHGQGAHLALLRPEQHIFYLDRFAGCVPLREEVGTLVTRWRAVRRELDTLQRDERELARRAELLRFQAEEIAAARLQAGELEALEREQRMLANAERLGELCVAIHGALAGDDAGEEHAALDLLAGARRALDELLRLDPTLTEQATALDEAMFRLEDVAAGVRSYQDEIAADPARLAEVEERLDLIARLRRKYGTTVEEVIAYGASAGEELDRLTHREERTAQLQEQEGQLREEIGVRAARLSRARQEAAAALARAMERELEDLHMTRARFQVEIRHKPDAAGVPARLEGTPRPRAGAPASAERYAFGPLGIDQVEFLIAPNLGEPFKPLARIASGGETSRLMLAIKSILSTADAVPILIFDEIDAGISGRAGQVVGAKLWRLARGHQVICVTHLPQIAALGDSHFRVAKQVTGERTTTVVEALSGPARVAEIGQLLGGTASRAASANAADLLARSADWKTERPTAVQT
jgi:DNA repair protein RecN (Recombination protein N)